MTPNHHASLPAAFHLFHIKIGVDLIKLINTTENSLTKLKINSFVDRKVKLSINWSLGWIGHKRDLSPPQRTLSTQ